MAYLKELLFISILIYSLATANCQIIICNKEHSHPVDIKAIEIADSLGNRGVDTILVYRHWLGMNGYNGYGKVLWLKNGVVNQYYIDFKNHIDDYGIKSIMHSIVQNTVFTFFAANRIDTVTSQPVSKTEGIDHDSNHFVLIIIGLNRKCFEVYGQALYDNSSHPYSQIIARVIGRENKSNPNQ